jgi:DNA-binding GntR family transcriptional regulator
MNGRPATRSETGEVPAAIRDAIIKGDFAPNQRLVESDLSEQFGASRSGVRSAPFELANEGLVERVRLSIIDALRSV